MRYRFSKPSTASPFVPLLQGLEGGLPVVGMHEVQERTAQELLLGPAQDVGEGGIHPEEVAGGIGDAEQIQRDGEEALELELRLLALGDVLYGAVDADHPTPLGRGPEAGRDPADLPVRALDPELGVDRRAVLFDPPLQLQALLPVVGMDALDEVLEGGGFVPVVEA